jgi:exodeoxyribonuclease-5
MEIVKIKPRINPPGFKTDQIEGINRLNDFINDPNALEFTLSGAAGSGKTYMLKWFVNNLCNFPTCPTAPTHKAVRVVEKTLMRKGKTLQSLHGLRPNFDISNFDISNPQFDPRGIERIKDYKLVIIDEASMITNDLYLLNLERAKQYNVKILYVGDSYQLPAITKNGKAINPSDSLVFKNPNQFTLKEIVRQEEGHPLLQLFPLIRNDIEKGTNSFLKYIFEHRKNITNDTGYEIINDVVFKNTVDNYFNLNKLKSNLDYTRVLAYSNEAVGVNNTFIRNKVLNNPKDLLTKDDILTSYTTIVDEFNYPIIINSEDYYINTIREYINHNEIKTYAVNLQSAFDNRLTQTIQIVDHTDKSFVIYYKILAGLHDAAVKADKMERSKRWIEYFKFKESILTMVSFDIVNNNKKTTVKKDIDYGYSITTHKSQGSTFENVIMDLRDIAYYFKNGKYNKRFDTDMVNRLIYVALSRATNKVLMKL